jgi:hypothetical protein
MIKQDGKTWYWCDQDKYGPKGVVTNGMYVTHKPENHGLWHERQRKGKKGPAKNPLPPRVQPNQPSQLYPGLSILLP